MKTLTPTIAMLAALACGTSRTPSEGTSPGHCSDGSDNDRDGLVDCLDPGCTGQSECVGFDAGPQTDAGLVDSQVALDVVIGDAGQDAARDADVEIDQLCEASVARGERCGTPISSSECHEEIACVRTYFRRDTIIAIARCDNARECAASDDPCFDVGSLGISPSAVGEQYQAACTTRSNECALDVECMFFGALATDERIAQASACLEMPCAAISACVRTAFSCGDSR